MSFSCIKSGYRHSNHELSCINKPCSCYLKEKKYLDPGTSVFAHWKNLINNLPWFLALHFVNWLNPHIIASLPRSAVVVTFYSWMQVAMLNPHVPFGGGGHLRWNILETRSLSKFEVDMTFHISCLATSSTCRHHCMALTGGLRTGSRISSGASASRTTKRSVRIFHKAVSKWEGVVLQYQYVHQKPLRNRIGWVLIACCSND